jgi:uncharacterized Tic20 family protein
MDNEIRPPDPQPPGSQPPGSQPPSPEPPTSPPPSPQPPPVRQDRTLDATCHFLSFAGFMFPVGNIIGPIILWAIKKDEIPSVNEHGKEAVHFQISMTIYTIIAALSTLILIGFVLLPAIVVLDIVLVIIAGVKAANGEFYRYPLTIRFIK